jgi:hypothetical protein
MVVLSLHTGTSDHGNGPRCNSSHERRMDSDVTRGLCVAQAVRRLVSDGCGAGWW